MAVVDIVGDTPAEDMQVVGSLAEGGIPEGGTLAVEGIHKGVLQKSTNIDNLYPLNYKMRYNAIKELSCHILI